MTLKLAGLEPFAHGGNRLCFVNPLNGDQCVKVARPGFTAAEKRRKKGLPKSLKPLSSFDDNLQEYRALTDIHTRTGAAASSLIPRCYGLLPTDRGPGIITDLIKDADGKISITLKQYLWENGVTATLEQGLEGFRQQWLALAIPSRDLLLHNLVVRQTADGKLRPMVIDGLGWSDLIPLGKLFPSLARHKAQRKLANLETRIQTLLTVKKQGGPWGYHGYLEPQNRRIENDIK